MPQNVSKLLWMDEETRDLVAKASNSSGVSQAEIYREGGRRYARQLLGGGNDSSQSKPEGREDS